MTTSEKTCNTVLDRKFLIERRNVYETSITWKIKKFSVTAAKPDERIVSPVFHCADAFWKLIVYPNGQRLFRNVGNILMFLHKAHSPILKHSTIFKFDVIDNQQKKVYEMLPLKAQFRGTKKVLYCIIKRDDVIGSDGILSNDTLTVAFDLTITEKDSVASSTDDSNDEDLGIPETCNTCLKPLIGDFETLYHYPKFSDVTLKLGEREFPAHKVVLGSRSRVFEAMFEHDMKEKRNSTVHLIEMEADTVELMLGYIYCGDIPQLSPDNAIHLYVAADRYDLQDLLKTCRSIVLENISMSNICDVAVVSDLHEDTQLTNAVQSFLFQNIKELLKTERWKLFSKEQSDLSVKLLESVILNK